MHVKVAPWNLIIFSNDREQKSHYYHTPNKDYDNNFAFLIIYSEPPDTQLPIYQNILLAAVFQLECLSPKPMEKNKISYLCRHSILVHFPSHWRTSEVLSFAYWYIKLNFSKFLSIFYKNHTHLSLARSKKACSHETNDDLTHSVFIWNCSWFLGKRHEVS